MHSVVTMGYARSGRDKRDLSEFQTVYQDPDYERMRAGGARRRDKIAGSLAGGSALETLGALTALVAAIVGFAYQPAQMAGIATIAIGVALFSQGLAIMARWREAMRRLDKARIDRGEIVGGVSTEVFAGITGIVLGIVALSGVRPSVLLAAAVTMYGGALLLGGAAQPDLVYLAPDRNPRHGRVTFDAIQASGGIMVLVGVSAAVLGILALLQVGPALSLTLVALLAIAGALVFAGGALAARLLHRAT